MRPTLEALFDAVGDESVRMAIAQEEARVRLRADLNSTAASRSAGVEIPGDQYADNLLMGLLALRDKFERDEALQKLDVNLSMRSRRQSGRE